MEISDNTRNKFEKRIELYLNKDFLHFPPNFSTMFDFFLEVAQRPFHLHKYSNMAKKIDGKMKKIPFQVAL